MPFEIPLNELQVGDFLQVPGGSAKVTKITPRHYFTDIGRLDRSTIDMLRPGALREVPLKADFNLILKYRPVVDGYVIPGHLLHRDRWNGAVVSVQIESAPNAKVDFISEEQQPDESIAESLRDLCQCPRCRARRARERGEQPLDAEVKADNADPLDKLSAGNFEKFDSMDRILGAAIDKLEGVKGSRKDVQEAFKMARDGLRKMSFWLKKAEQFSRMGG